MNTTTVSTPTDTTIVITRAFDAPIALVFAAHTEPAHLTSWLTGPGGFKLVTVTADIRSGGSYVWHYEGPDGSSMDQRGEYIEVDAPHRLVMRDDWGPEMPRPIVETTFVETGGQTVVTITMTLADKALRDHVITQGGMVAGYTESHANLDALLPGLA